MIEAKAHKVPCLLHGLWRSIGILKHSGITDDAGIDADSSVFIDRIASYHVIYKLSRGTCIRHDIRVRLIRYALVPQMMVYADPLRSIVLDLCVSSEPLPVSEIERYEEIICLIGGFGLYLIITRKERKLGIRIQQIHIRLYFRESFFQKSG